MIYRDVFGGEIMGILKGLVKVGFIGLSFVSGYSFYKFINDDPRYYVKRINERIYLVDKQNNKNLEIDQENFQLGSIRYRFLGLLKDSKFVPTLESLLQEEK